MANFISGFDSIGIRKRTWVMHDDGKCGVDEHVELRRNIKRACLPLTLEESSAVEVEKARSRRFEALTDEYICALELMNDKNDATIAGCGLDGHPTARPGFEPPAS